MAPQFLTSSLDRDEWPASRPGRFTHWVKAPGTHCIGVWVLRRRKYVLPLPGIEPRPFSLKPIAIPTELSRLIRQVLLG
jgi:hypothetical protein